MTKLSILFLFITFTSNTNAQDSSITNAFDLFFKTYVENGKVNYQLIKSDNQLLNSLTKLIENTELTNFSPSQQKAFWINSYNLLVIKQIVETYPIQSPQDVPGFFNGVKHPIANEKLTLNEIETDKLRNNFHDARLHFVLVCGANGCPPIVNYAYKAAVLEKQLDIQTSLSLQDNTFIKVNIAKKQYSLSEMFHWYDSDFRTSGNSTLDFINRYRHVKIPVDYRSNFYTYDWSLNDTELIRESKNSASGTQAYSPSVLLKTNQWELKHFNNLYTQTANFDEAGKRNENVMRATYFTSINQFLIGFSSKLNIGLDVWFKSVRIDAKSSSPFSIFKFEDNSHSRTAITNLGPKIKFVPIKKFQRLSIQSTFLFPIASDLEGTSNSKPYLSAHSYFFINQLFYDQPINSKIQLFFQVAPWLSFTENNHSIKIGIATPVSAFLSYFPTNRWTFYFQNEFYPTYGKTGSSSYFLQQGMGIKYQLIKGIMELESLYTRFTLGKNSGAGETYNFGIRIIH
ncbi:MAG: DUF547 domain-containing protein [Bacteroidota bacterium]|nr:DUF547 domain-containing protein [Bacteroidota bacterium]